MFPRVDWEWLAHWGFALLVLAAALGAVYLSLKTRVPAQVPDFALKAEAVYRMEIGAAMFAGFYVVMAIVLALNGRGFSEIGVNGLKAQDMANKAQQDAIGSQGESIAILVGMVEEIERSIRDLEARISANLAANGD